MRNVRSFYKLHIFIIFFLFLVTYWRVPQLFFIQDEWQTFGLVIGNEISLILRGLGDEKIFHFIPIDNFLNFISYQLFDLHHQLYNIVGLLFHFINGLLVYKLVKKIFKDSFLPLIACIIFITSSIPSQLIMWPVVSLNTLSLTFTLLTWFFVLDLNNNLTPSKLFHLGLKVGFFLLLSLLTLEYSAGLIVFIPLAAFVYLKKNKAKKLFIFLPPFLLIVIFYLSLRVYPILTSSQISTGHSLLLTNSISEIFIQFPLRYIGQVFIPQQLIENLAVILSVKFDDLPEHFFPWIAFITGLIILITCLLALLIEKTKLKGNKWNQHLVLAILFILCSSLPFLALPGLLGSFTLYPPRYLYFGMVGAVFLLAAVIDFILKNDNKNLKILTFLIISLYILYNIWGNWITSENLYKQGQERLKILNTVKEEYPKLTREIIFYTESDSSFYGLSPSERVLPFQSGFGQTLLVWYHKEENFPKELFHNKFLWGITEEGFKKVENRGFGYFRNFEKMANIISQNNISLDNVVAFKFVSKQGIMVTNISEEIQGRLKGYLSNREKLPQNSYTITSPYNSEDIRFTVDGDRKTFWDSKLTYDNYQYLQIDLGLSRVIAEIEIDSYNNRNQNQVGYKVSSSNDGKKWIQLFESRVIPPNAQGLVKLYFLPTKARYFKVDQIGYHGFANWIIHEINLYEVI